MSTTPLVLLVGGRLTSGKDAFADHLVEQHGFVKLGMSDTLALALYRLNPWVGVNLDRTDIVPRRYQDLVDLVGYVEAKKNPEVRRLLQQLGTEVGRQLLGENIWVDAARKKILELTSAGQNVVITGIRFDNEIALEQQLNYSSSARLSAVSVYVDRPSLPAPVEGHSSEGSVTPDQFQYQLLNDGTLEQLYTRGTQLLKEIAHDYL